MSTGTPILTATGFAADGTQLSTESIPGYYSAVGDAAGGLLALSTDFTSIVKVAGSASSPPWTYQSSGFVSSYNIAQAPDDTVYFVEAQSGTNGGEDNYLVGLDGLTGQVKRRVLLPGFISGGRAVGHCAGTIGPDTSYAFPSGPMGIGGDGGAYVLIQTGHQIDTTVCDYPDTWFYSDSDDQWESRPNTNIHIGAGTIDWISQVQVAHLDPDGNSTMSSPVAVKSYYGPDAVGVESSFESPAFNPVMSDASSGAFLSWYYYSAATGQDSPGFIRAVGSSVIALPSDLALNGAIELTTSSGTAYISTSDSDGNNHFSAVDIPTWTTLWSGHNNAAPAFETDDGHLIAVDYDDSFTVASLIEVDRSGATVSTTPVASLLFDPTLIVRGQASLHGTDVAGAPLEIATQEFIEVSSFVANGKGINSCEEPPLIPQTIEGMPYALYHKPLVPGRTYTYGYVGNWSGSDDANFQSGIKGAFDAWNASITAWNDNSTNPNGSTQNGQIGVQFSPVDGDAQPDIQITRQLFTNGRGGEFIPLSYVSASDRRIYGGNVVLNSSRFVLSKDSGYKKATLHEIGHSLGLYHTPVDKYGFPAGASVMNPLGGINDAGRQIPDRPTDCDLRMVARYLRQ